MGVIVSSPLFLMTLLTGGRMCPVNRFVGDLTVPPSFEKVLTGTTPFHGSFFNKSSQGQNIPLD